MFYRARTEEQATRVRRARALLALAAVAFAIGVIAGAGHGTSASKQLAARFAAAWAERDYTRMYLTLDAASRRAISPAAFAAQYERALRAATATGLRVTGKPRGRSAGVVAVP